MSTDKDFLIADLGAEEALRQSEERLQGILNQATAGILQSDLNGRLTFVNNRFCEITGYTREELLGMSMQNLTHEDDIAGNLASFARMVTEGTPFVIEKRCVRKDGSHVWVSNSGSLIRDAAGEPSSCIAVTLDITERKQTEEALSEAARSLIRQSRIFNMTLSTITDFTYIFDKEGRFVYSNQPLLDLLGVTLEEVIGKNFFDLKYPDDLAARLQRQIQQVFDTGEAVRDETLFINANGVEGFYEYIFNPVIAADGSVDAVAGSTRDVSERKRTENELRELEERFRAMFEQANVGIVQASFDGQLLKVNPGFCKIIGYTEDEARGLTISDITHPEDYELEQNETLRMLAGEISGYSIEKRYFHKTNGIVWGNTTATLVRYESGEPFYMLAIIEDISERKQAEEALRRSRDELETRVDERTHELSVTVDALVAEVHERTAAQERARSLVKMIVTTQEDERHRIARDLHDHLGQHLTGLRLKLETHKQRCEDDVGSCKEIGEIQEIAKRIDEDVDFLAWELRPVSLEELGLATALSTFVSEWSKHVGIPAQFHTTLSDQDRLSPEAEINFYRIAQEALNNVSKHAVATSVDVIFERLNDQALLIIEDNGKGFDPNDKAQQDNKRIGLINMHERASFIGGTFEIESNFGEGTTVFARAPITTAKRISYESTEKQHEAKVPD